MLGALKSYLDDTSYIRIENIDSTALNKLTGFDCLIIDEAHHSAAKTYRKLNKTAWKGIYYRFFMTATPFRNDNEETLLFESICGQVVYTLAYTEAVKSKRIVPVEAYYIEVPKKKTDAHTWGQVYSQLVVNNEDRNMQIALIALRLNSECIPTLILVKEVKHGELLSNMTGLPFANGKDEETREYIQQFNAGKIKALIGTEGILGEGVDTKPCEYVIIGGLGKAKSAFMQKVGRAVRAYVGKESAKVVLFCDKSHKFTLKHFKEQCKILKEEYQVTAIKLDL
jgi:superfamily II DNA or RNA helicase